MALVVGSVEIYLPLAGMVDLAEEKNRLEKELKETQHHLRHLTDYAIAYYQKLLEKYGKGRERKTEIRTFDTISASVLPFNATTSVICGWPRVCPSGNWRRRWTSPGRP